MATHSSILAWEIPWTEESGGLQLTELQRVGQDLETKQYIYIYIGKLGAPNSDDGLHEHKRLDLDLQARTQYLLIFHLHKACVYSSCTKAQPNVPCPFYEGLIAFAQLCVL